jgi:hypothetical protein
MVQPVLMVSIRIRATVLLASLVKIALRTSMTVHPAPARMGELVWMVSIPIRATALLASVVKTVQ